VKDVLLEIGKFIFIALIGGITIVALTSFISTPAIIVRYAITHSTAEQSLTVINSLRAALLTIVFVFIIRFMIKLIADY
jgi:hypothetical protein